MVAWRRTAPINLRQIEVFRAVMVTGVTTDTMPLLQVSQPGARRLLRLLELRLGVALFERREGRLVAAPETHTLHQQIERVDGAVRQAQDVAQHLRPGHHAMLRRLSSAITAWQWAPRAIARLIDSAPHARIHVEALPTREIVKRLVAEESDVAVVSTPLDHPALRVRATGHWRLVCAWPQGHALTAGSALRRQDALRQRWIVYSPEAPQTTVSYACWRSTPSIDRWPWNCARSLRLVR